MELHVPCNHNFSCILKLKKHPGCSWNKYFHFLSKWKAVLSVNFLKLDILVQCLIIKWLKSVGGFKHSDHFIITLLTVDLVDLI